MEPEKNQGTRHRDRADAGRRVYSKRAERIEIVLGEGIHNMKCELTPTRMGLSYAGTVRGRELVYERSRAQVQADLDLLNPALREPRRR